MLQRQIEGRIGTYWDVLGCIALTIITVAICCNRIVGINLCESTSEARANTARKSWHGDSLGQGLCCDYLLVLWTSNYLHHLRYAVHSIPLKYI